VSRLNRLRARENRRSSNVTLTRIVLFPKVLLDLHQAADERFGVVEAEHFADHRHARPVHLSTHPVPRFDHHLHHRVNTGFRVDAELPVQLRGLDGR
jgi:hypothetical protein